MNHLFFGNGNLLTAIALMYGGWDGNQTKNISFPKKEKWKVKK